MANIVDIAIYSKPLKIIDLNHDLLLNMTQSNLVMYVYRYVSFAAEKENINFFRKICSLHESVSPGFLFIRMFIMIYLFILDDSLTS